MIALLVAGGFSLAFTLLLTPVFIKLFKRLKWGQFIRDDGPQSHHSKRPAIGLDSTGFLCTHLTHLGRP